MVIPCSFSTLSYFGDDTICHSQDLSQKAVKHREKVCKGETECSSSVLTDQREESRLPLFPDCDLPVQHNFFREYVEIFRAYAARKWSIHAHFAYALSLKPTTCSHCMTSRSLCMLELSHEVRESRRML
jgi:hypothetical protein